MVSLIFVCSSPNTIAASSRRMSSPQEDGLMATSTESNPPAQGQGAAAAAPQGVGPVAPKVDPSAAPQAKAAPATSPATAQRTAAPSAQGSTKAPATAAPQAKAATPAQSRDGSGTSPPQARS